MAKQGYDQPDGGHNTKPQDAPRYAVWHKRADENHADRRDRKEDLCNLNEIE